MFLPIWALVAIAGHLANGVAFIIDKTLLTTSFKRSATYAGTVGLLSIVVLVLIPFGVHLPQSTSWLWMTIAGISFVTALWAFFSALSMGEASRVVPIIGSLIPVLTLVGTSQLLHERLAQNQLIGFGILIISTIILAGGSAKQRLSKKTIWISILSAALFAVSSVTVKLSYESEGFINGFFFSRLIGVVTACFILFIDQKALQEAKQAFFPSRSASSHKQIKRSSASILILVGQGLGSVGFILVQYAINLGSAAIVNALQAVQYAFLVLVAFVLSSRAPKLLGEDLTMRSIIQKSTGIALTAIGLWFVV
jgi:drug/metabolite transporter (DMT)-like permease